MQIKSLLIAVLLFFSMVLRVDALGGPPQLTAKQFLEKGAWVLLGKVHELKILRQDENYEYGDVVIRVDEVLEGKVNAPLISFPYQRKLERPKIRFAFKHYPWEYFSRPEVGKKFLIYFEEKDGTYSLFKWAANPVQEIIEFDDPNWTAFFDLQLGPTKLKALKEIIRLHHLPR